MADEIKVSIAEVAASLRNAGAKFVAHWQTFGWSTSVNAQNGVNWTAPSISVDELISEFENAARRVETLKGKTFSVKIGEFCVRLKQNADAVMFQNISSDFDANFGSAFELINSVFRHIDPPALPAPTPKVDWEDLKDERNLLPKDLARRLRFVEARLVELEPRSATVAEKITEIEAAREAAEQLPADLEDLRSQRAEMTKIAEVAAHASGEIATAQTRAEDGQRRIEKLEAESATRIAASLEAADNMIRRSEQALRGATSVGLAKAFEDRSKALTGTGANWTYGLAIALAAALGVGVFRVYAMKDVLDGTKPASVVWANILLTILGVGAPIWFAWLSTRQIGTTFKLAEDYAFKASVSQAYEGYRAEAVEIDPLLRERLFASALTRIEEAPIRLLNDDTYNSPLSELLANPAIRKGLEAVPGISEKLIALIPGKAGATAIIAPAAVSAAVAGILSDEPTLSIKSGIAEKA